MKTFKYSDPVLWSFKTYFLFFVFCTFSLNSVAQYSIHLRIVNVPASHVTDSIFIAGNFNEWNPGDEKFRFTKSNDVFSLDITGLKENIYQFKFTRGNWGKGEVNNSGKAIENRLIILSSDTTLEYIIEGWQDDFPIETKRHTASSHVSILDTAFFMPQLNRYRRIWIYLPEGYAAHKNKKHYPVIYMHDGQNVFDEYTANYGEWGVDECLDSLIKNGKPASIVVGIDNGERRMNEYNPYAFEDYGDGEGDEYIDFLVKTLKPFIDKHYRTLSSKENTIIAGSSMGGLISYYATLTHPEVFGNAGVFSPSFWVAPKLGALSDSLGNHLNGKIFFFIGDLEGNEYVTDLKEMAERIGKSSKAVIYTLIDPDSRHNETAWRKWFAEFYTWIIGDGFNQVIKTD